ncbi:DedA family protein [Zavarzinia sp. CC-PAN008]|uniref:DedA family protein n=1 Tax=Zavarzinia sp. CC-PAN008 TaxID=3243332 RepID=UPI003F749649
MVEWVTGIMEQLGVLGVGILMFLENVFPPIPSEVIMPLAGFAAARGELSLIGVIVAGILGTMMGAIPWYVVGLYLNEARLVQLANRHGRWFGLKGDDVTMVCAWFNRFGPVAVLIGRVVPGVRTLISVPAGTTRMPIATFVVFSTLGTSIWVAALAIAGYVMGENWHRIEDLLPSGTVIVGILALAIVILVAWRVRRARAAARGQG